MVELIEWATERPLFTLNEADRAFDLTRESLREQLSRLVSRGELNRVERGKYTIHDDPLIYATHIETPSYLTLWSGLRFYDLTTQQPTRIQVMTSNPRDDLPAIKFHVSSDLFGFGKRRYRDFEVFVADEERLLIDCLSRRGVPVSALDELLETVDPNRCVEYALRFDRKAVTKRVGFLLEHAQGTVRDELRVDDRNYPRLDLNGADVGDSNAKWRLQVNTDAHENRT